MPADAPLRIALLTYRGKPHVGGQGVYTRHLAKALVELGHHVEVLGGQPYPILDERVPLVELPSLDIYNDHFPMRMPGLWELKHWTDFVEVTAFSAGTFPEPLAFSMRAWDHLRHRKDDFDIVQDNQCLGYGLRLERGGGAGGSPGRVGVPRAVLRHAGGCPRCARLLDDLAAIDTELPPVLAESLLGEAGRRYLAVRAPTVTT